MRKTGTITTKRNRKKSILCILTATILILAGLFFLFMPAIFIWQYFSADSSMAFFLGMLCIGLGLVLATSLC
jgi:hypothetical protein